ncbi:hypothetical protein EVU91_04600 [Macrococcoides bohemicum]|uniref:hypothetical protein n=1 Tax=Macrococcoides bohemicum TaxID=1903056 RepID=UPI00105A7FD0|nr:hypothetical protein [Macrococcus bohemicus]TDL39429.1 hypothetical protein EVU91_04600 [Macrococcus bohemicus]
MFKHFKDVTKPTRKITKFFTDLDTFTDVLVEITNKSNAQAEYARKPRRNETGVIVWIEK